MAGWRDDAVPQREELELGRRLPGAGDVPLAGQDQAGPGPIEIVAHLDLLPTILAVASDTEVKDKLAKGYKVGDMTYKVHLDGDDIVYGKAEKDRARNRFYVNDDQQLTGLRYDNWKMAFMEQRATGTLRIWAEPFAESPGPEVFNLRLDPYERADVTSNLYDWLIDHIFLLVPPQDYVAGLPGVVQGISRAAEGGKLNLNEVMEKLKESRRSPLSDTNDLRPCSAAGRSDYQLDRLVQSRLDSTVLTAGRSRPVYFDEQALSGSAGI